MIYVIVLRKIPEVMFYGIKHGIMGNNGEKNQLSWQTISGSI